MISERYQFGLELEVGRVNFHLSITVLILFGSPSTTLLFLSLFTEIISLTNLTVKNRAVAVFSKFSTTEDFIPINVNSDFILFLKIHCRSEVATYF